MARNKGIANGVAALTKDMNALQEGAFGAVAALATGASKAQVAWAGFSQFFITKILGPVGLFTSTAIGAAIAINKMGRAFAQMGMEASKSFETLTTRFKPLLLGLESAKKRMEDLAKFAASTPFQLPGIAEANRTLQSLTKGALATEEGMTLVGDAASVAGVSIEEMSTTIGRLYDGLQSGRPVGEVASRLQELGVISGTTRNQLESMQAAGRAGSDVWKVAAQDIARAQGAMKDLSATLGGLQSNLDDSKEAFQRAFSDNYLEGEKAMVKATADAYERLAPIVGEVGKQISITANAWDRLKAFLIDSITSVPGLGKAVVFLTNTVITLTTGIIGASAAMGGAFLANLLRTGSAVRSAAQGYSGLWAAMEIAKVGVTDLIEGDKVMAKEAMNMSKNVAASSLHFIKNAGFAGTLKAALQGVGALAKWAGREFLSLFTALAANPVFLLMTALAGVAIAMKHFSDKARDARAEIVTMNNAIREQTSLLDKQRNSIRTIADLNAQYAAELTRATVARSRQIDAERNYSDEPTAQNKQKLDAANRDVAASDRGIRQTKKIKTSMLETGPNLMKTEDKLRINKSIEDAKFEYGLSTGSSDDQVKMLEVRKRAIEKRNETFQNSQFNTESSADVQRNMGFNKAKMTSELRSLEKSRGDASNKLSESQGGGPVEKSKEIMDLDSKIKALKEKLKSLPDAASEVNKVLTKGNVIDVLQANISAIDELASANDALIQSTKDLNAAEAEHAAHSKASGDNDSKAKNEAIQKEKDAKAAIAANKSRVGDAEKIVGALGINPKNSAREKEDAQGRINFERERQNASPQELADIQNRKYAIQRDSGIKNKNDQFDNEGKSEKADSQESRGQSGDVATEYALQVKLLSIEQKRLQYMHEMGKISDEELKSGTENLKLEQKLLDVETQRAQKKALLAQKISGNASDESYKESRGNDSGARVSRQRRLKEERELKRMELEDEARAKFKDPKKAREYVKEGDKQNKIEAKIDRLANSQSNINNLAQGWADFLAAFKAMMNKAREYKESIKLKELRASGRDEDTKEADKIEGANRYENRIKEVRKDTGANLKDTEKYVNREFKAEFDKNKRESLASLQEELKQKTDEKNEGLRDAFKNTHHLDNNVQSSMSKIGGSMAFTTADVSYSDAPKQAHKDAQDIKKILAAIQKASSDTYTVHSVRPQVNDLLTVFTAQGARTIQV